ncbi:MAG: sensor histidine kinase [Propionibacteriaceae bacterium]
MQTSIRWDRLILRILICGAIVLSVVPSAIATGIATWRGVLALGLAAALCLMMLLSYRLGGSGGEKWHRPGLTAPVALATAAIVVVLPANAVSWLPFVGVSMVAVTSIGLARSIVLAAVPFLAIMARSWLVSHDLANVCINAVAAMAIFALVVTRQRQREAEELSRAQGEVIEGERTLVEAADRRRELAAQLHDVLAHTLSGLIVTLQGASHAAAKEHVSAELAERLATATDLAKDGLAEARSAVETLHREADQAPVALRGWLDETVTRLGSATGIVVTVNGSADTVPADWTDLARSMLMESLTNSLRHAAGAPVTITFDSSGTGDAPGVPTLTVLSAGTVRDFTDRGHSSGGHGLSGLTDRVTDRGGSIRCGPADDGFLVQISMPTRTAAMAWP